ncbi:hypothetical protein B0H17DRAFT_367524 [Mycena rosella]|uniref:Uncharacterized protein n=1 Tax=Mycena rosella TaxID=1033263 RepID=A0AAD7H045_MYCRO|nr:hypothetical protein B0H17DRAFT_367524 [Mycena rosella]
MHTRSEYSSTSLKKTRAAPRFVQTVVATGLLPFITPYFSAEVVATVDRYVPLSSAIHFPNIVYLLGIVSLPRQTLRAATWEIFLSYVVESARHNSQHHDGGDPPADGSGSGGNGAGPPTDGGAGPPNNGDGPPGGGDSPPNDSAGPSNDGEGPPDGRDGPSKNGSPDDGGAPRGYNIRSAPKREIMTLFTSLCRALTRTRVSEKEEKNRLRIVKNAAKTFDTKFHENFQFPSFSLEAFPDESANPPIPLVSLFHATRYDQLENFKVIGVATNSRGSSSSELHHLPAFYTSNTVANGVAHTLQYHHRPQPPHNLLGHRIVVIAFAVPPRVILGYDPSEGGFKFRTRIFRVPEEGQQGYTTKYADFCAFVSRNWCQTLDAAQTVQANMTDFCIAPICLTPASRSVGVEENLRDGGPRLMQVAACSPRARDYLNECIVEVVVENRTGV